MSSSQQGLPLQDSLPGTRGAGQQLRYLTANVNVAILGIVGMAVGGCQEGRTTGRWTVSVRNAGRGGLATASRKVRRWAEVR